MSEAPKKKTIDHPHYLVEELLSGEELTELETFARKPGRTIDDIHEWMLAKGYTLSRKAAWSWKKKFDGLVLKERFSRSSELAQAIKSAVKTENFSDVADAAAMQLTQVVFEQAAKLQGDADIDPLDVQRMTRSLNNLIAGKAKLAEKFDQAAAQLAEKVKSDRKITPEDLATIRKAVFGS